MVIVMEHAATEEQMEKVIELLVGVGYDVHRSTGVSHTVLGAVGVPREPVEPSALELLPGVAEVLKISEPYKLVGRTFKPADTVVDDRRGEGGRERGHRHGRPLLGGDARSRCARWRGRWPPPGRGCCAGGAFKPRTSPYSFQGHGEKALRWMREAADECGLAVVSEVMDPRSLEMMLRYVDCLQVGARNMQNFDLLKELGPGAQARAAEARPGRHHRGVAALRGVHPRRGQPPR